MHRRERSPHLWMCSFLLCLFLSAVVGHAKVTMQLDKISPVALHIVLVFG